MSCSRCALATAHIYKLCLQKSKVRTVKTKQGKRVSVENLEYDKKYVSRLYRTTIHNFARFQNIFGSL